MHNFVNLIRLTTSDFWKTVSRNSVNCFSGGINGKNILPYTPATDGCYRGGVSCFKNYFNIFRYLYNNIPLLIKYY